VNSSTATATRQDNWLRRFFVREDPVYANYESAYQAKTAPAKALYLFLYLAPGIVAFVFINIGPIFRAQMVLRVFPRDIFSMLGCSSSLLAGICSCHSSCLG
jgi:hypothetical protein